MLSFGTVLTACSDPEPSPTDTSTTDDTGADDTGTDATSEVDGALTDVLAGDADTADTADSDTSPPPSCPCVHGTCSPADSTTCACHPGWEGALCDTLGDTLVVPWDSSDATPGTGIKDRVQDFTLPLLGTGPVALSTLWSGEDSVLFILKAATSTYNSDVWSSDVASLLDRLPANVHVVFGSLDTAWAADIAAIKTRMDAALVSLDSDVQAHWQQRFHYIDQQANGLDGSVGDFIAQHGAFFFAIDRFQRWREVGLIWDLTNDSRPMGFIANEAAYFNFEARQFWEIEGMHRDLGATVVEVWGDGDRHLGGWGAGHSSRWDVTLPDADTMATFDSMALWVDTACPGHKQGLDAGCNEWDYIQTVYICDQPAATEDAPSVTQACLADDPANPGSPETLACACNAPGGSAVFGQRTCQPDGQSFGACQCACDTELARYVTTYGREGKWLTDLSPLLPLVGTGGKQTLRFVGANGYDLQGNLVLWDSGSGRRPVGIQYLWGRPGGTPFNLTYNDAQVHPPMAFDLPAGATEVAMYAVVSGHGNGSTSKNCAEFCNHQHEFTINDQVFWLEHPTAGTSYGCLERIADGVVPNQFGTWQLGRAGWCAGQDVKPFIQGLTPLVDPTGNTLSYRGLVNYQPYSPIVTNPEGYQPEIKMASWLVFYAPN